LLDGVMNESFRMTFWREAETAHVADAYAVLDAAYRQPHRAYHTWEHIEALLEGLRRFERLAIRPDLIAIAIFWHDAVHRARETDGRPRRDIQNVRESVDMFRRYTKLRGSEAQAVEDLVLATADHAHARAATEHYPGFSGDLDLLIDLDLSPLAAPWEDFADNTRKIRDESQGVEETKFAADQANMLESLARGDAPIFRRAETRALWDAAARANLDRCIPRLRAAGGRG
jgi:predicted metal-dependent HD superfamily phosphohydrolase